MKRMDQESTPTGGTRSTASHCGPRGPGPSTRLVPAMEGPLPRGPDASRSSRGETRPSNQSSLAGRGGTRPSNPSSFTDRPGTRPCRRRPAHPPIAEPFNRAIIVFVTVCTKDRQPLLANPYIHDLLLRAWESASQWVVGRYVIMPDHLHLFCAPATWPPTSLRRWVAYWKSLVARAVRGFGPLGGTHSTASLGPGGTGPSTPNGGTASTASVGGTPSTASGSGRGGTRPSKVFWQQDF